MLDVDYTSKSVFLFIDCNRSVSIQGSMEATISLYIRASVWGKQFS